jgi:PAS domain S-box-containing protein
MPVLARPFRQRETLILPKNALSVLKAEQPRMPPNLRPEHLLATILSSTEDGLLSFLLDGTIQTWSRGAERLYGYSEAEITERAIKVLLPIYELSTFEEFLKGVKEGVCGCSEKCRTYSERRRKDPPRAEKGRGSRRKRRSDRSRGVGQPK